MITTFSLKKDGETNITQHFKVREFRSKCGSDVIIIDGYFVVYFLQRVRDNFKKPTTITRGFSPLQNLLKMQIIIENNYETINMHNL